MPNANDMRWFKQQFGAEIETAIQGSPFSLDFLTALACQEIYVAGAGECGRTLHGANIARSPALNA